MKVQLTIQIRTDNERPKLQFHEMGLFIRHAEMCESIEHLSRISKFEIFELYYSFFFVFYFDEVKHRSAFFNHVTYIINDLCTLSLFVVRRSCRWVNEMTRDIVRTLTQSHEGITLATIFTSNARSIVSSN